MRDLSRVSKVNIRDLAGKIAETSTSNGRRIDPEALARRMWAGTRRCALCRKPSYVFGLYLPGEGADPVVLTGLGPGQARFLFYGLCIKCIQLDDAFVRVEDAIADGHLEEANARARLDAAGVGYTTQSAPDGSRWLGFSPPGEGGA